MERHQLPPTMMLNCFYNLSACSVAHYPAGVAGDTTTPSTTPSPCSTHQHCPTPPLDRLKSAPPFPVLHRRASIQLLTSWPSLDVPLEASLSLSSSAGVRRLSLSPPVI